MVVFYHLCLVLNILQIGTHKQDEQLDSSRQVANLAVEYFAQEAHTHERGE